MFSKYVFVHTTFKLKFQEILLTSLAQNSGNIVHCNMKQDRQKQEWPRLNSNHVNTSLNKIQCAEYEGAKKSARLTVR